MERKKHAVSRGDQENDSPASRLIARAREAINGTNSDIARLLGCSRQLITEIEKGRSKLQPYEAAKLAEVVGDQWFEQALPAMAEQARTREEKNFWMGKLKALSRSAVPAILALFTIAAPRADAVSIVTFEGISQDSPIYSGNSVIHSTRIYN